MIQKPQSTRLAVQVVGPTVQSRYAAWTAGTQQPIALVEAINLPGSGVAVTGTAQVGETLTADITNISDPNGFGRTPRYFYQWFRSNGLTDTRIEGATSATYDPVADDVGKTLKV